MSKKKVKLAFTREGSEVVTHIHQGESCIELSDGDLRDINGHRARFSGSHGATKSNVVKLDKLPPATPPTPGVA